MKYGELIHSKTTEIVATSCQILRLKIHQIQLWQWFCPRLYWGSLQHFRDL